MLSRAHRGSLPHPVAFHRTKYGPEILVDVAWIHAMPTFLLPQPHTLQFYDILLVTRGSGWFSLDGVRLRVAPGTVLFTTPGQVRHWSVRNLDGLCLFFPAAFLTEFFSDRDVLFRLPFFHVAAREARLSLSDAACLGMRRRLMTLMREFRHWREDSALLLRAALYQELLLLARAFRRQRGHSGPRALHRVAVAFRELVERRATPPQRIAWYARQLGVSPQHLGRITRTFLGASPKRVVQSHLEVEARRLLAWSDQSVAQIGFGLGFPDPTYFARFFRRHTGMTPSSFRRAARRAPVPG
jgi:AraC-like DNA-binding protein